MGANSTGVDVQGAGPNNVIAYPNIFQLFSDKGDEVAEYIKSSIPKWAVSLAGNALSTEALEEILNLQARLIVNEKGAPGFNKHSLMLLEFAI